MTPWEMEILCLLACRLRMLSLAQVSRTWWAGQQRAARNARESCESLRCGGWLEIRQVLSRPVEPLSGPLVSWTPGNRQPSFSKLSTRLHRRAQTPAREAIVLTASSKTRAHFGLGGDGVSIKLTQMTHDLHVGEVLLSYRRRGYDLRRWVGEDFFPSTWSVREQPDALLIDERGQFLRVIEYGGDYSVDRLLKLHRAVARIDLAYEIW